MHKYDTIYVYRICVYVCITYVYTCYGYTFMWKSIKGKVLSKFLTIVTSEIGKGE